MKNETILLNDETQATILKEGGAFVVKQKDTYDETKNRVFLTTDELIEMLRAAGVKITIEE